MQNWNLGLDAKPTAVQLCCAGRRGVREHQTPQILLFPLNAEKRNCLGHNTTRHEGGEFFHQGFVLQSFEFFNQRLCYGSKFNVTFLRKASGKST